MKKITIRNSLFAVAAAGLGLLGAYYVYEAATVINSESRPTIVDSPENRKYLPIATVLLDEDSKQCADLDTEKWARCLLSLRSSRAERLLVATEPELRSDLTVLAERKHWLDTNEKLIPVEQYTGHSGEVQQKARPKLHPWLSI